MRNFIKYFITIFGLSFVNLNADAAYSENTAGPVSWYATYADQDYIYFQLQNQPTSHPTCNPQYFVISETLPADRRKAMVARLALAYALKEAVVIGFGGAGDCSNAGFLKVYRVG